MRKLITAIQNIIHLPADVQLDCLTFHADSGTIVYLIKYHFIRHWYTDLFNLLSPKHFILSFHDSNGSIITNAGTVADPLVLKPVQAEAIKNCCPSSFSPFDSYTLATSPSKFVDVSPPMAQTIPFPSTSA